MSLQRFVDDCFYNTLDVLRRKGIPVYLSSNTPIGEGHRLQPLYSAKHFAIEVRPEDPLKADALLKLEDTLALACGCDSVIMTRERGWIWVQYTMPEEHWSTVTYEEIGGIGISQSGKTLAYEFNDSYPHAVVAGASGSGKSEFIRAIIKYLVDNNTPDNLRLAIVDPNGDYEDMKNLLHLTHRIATTPEDARKVIDDYYEELQRRVAANDREALRVVLICDEVQSDVVFGTSDTRKDKDNPYRDFNNDNLNQITQLARQGRKYRMHVIIGTQKPNHTDMPGILNNLTYAFIGKTFDASEAAKIGGAGTPGHKLLGQGDFFLKTPYGVERFQAALVTVRDYPTGVLLNPFKPDDPVTYKLIPPVVAEYIKEAITEELAKIRFGFNPEIHRMYEDFAGEIRRCLP